MPRWLRSMLGSDYHDDRYHYRKRKITYKDRDYDDRYRRRGSLYRDDAYYGSTAGRVVTTASQVCGACGKLRSPSWSSRHPLRYGEVPRGGLCRKCAAKSTSSERSVCSRRLPRVHRRPRTRHRHTGCTDDFYSSFESRDPYHVRRRYRSDSVGYIRPRSLVSVASTDDLVRVSRRVLVDRPVRRGILKTPSTCSVYSDEIVEGVLPRRRSLRRTRTRSGSSVHFVDELDKPYYRHRPRSLSRRSSREEIVVSRPRSYGRRRRPIYYDGPADVQNDHARRKWLEAAGRDASFTGSEGECSRAEPPKVSQKSQPGQKADFTNRADLRAKARKRKPEPTLLAKVSSEPNYIWSQPSQNLDGPSDKPMHPLDLVDSLDLNDQARKAFEDYSYDVDSQFPSPPPVNFAVPVHSQSRSLSPLRLPPRSLSKIQSRRDLGTCKTETFRPAYVNYELSNVAPLQRSYERFCNSSGSLDAQKSVQCPDTPLISITSSGPKPATADLTSNTADDPDHPDHVAYLLSTVHIASQFNCEENAGFRESDSKTLSCESLPTVLRHNRDQSYTDYDDASASTTNLDGGIEEPEKFHNARTDARKAIPLANISDEYAEHADKPYHPQFRDRGHKSVLRDIFDESELEQLH